MRQLLLNLPVNTDYSAESFVPTAASATASKALQQFQPNRQPHGGQALVLVGPAESGKTHLLHIWQQAQKGNSLAHAVDDLPALDAAAQQELFHLYNRLKEQGGALLLASTKPVQELPLLADLKSRLTTAQHITLAAPGDADLRLLVAKWAADRQLTLPPPVLEYLLARAERSATALHAMVTALDALSLEQKRAVTVPLLRQLFETLDGAVN